MSLFCNYPFLTSWAWKLLSYVATALAAGDLSIGVSAELKTPTIIVWGSMCDLSFSNYSFTNVSVLTFVA